MINPFLDFDNAGLSNEPLPLERIVRAKRRVRDALLAAYHRLASDRVKELRRLLDHGLRFNRYKTMLPGIELPEFLKTTLLQAAVVYDDSLRLIQSIEYTPADLDDFCALDGHVNAADAESCGPMGIFLSALINASKARHFVVTRYDLQPKLHLLGFRLEAGKQLLVHGDLGHFTGAGLDGGHLKVTGSTGSWCGADMTHGSIEIGGDALSKTGIRMKGGQIHVKGNIHEIAKDRSGGEILKRGQHLTSSGPLGIGKGHYAELE